MNKQVFLIATILSAITANSAQATFVSGAARWHALGTEHQYSYVTGMAAQKRDCAKLSRMDPAKMSRAISRFYASKPSLASLPKSQVFEITVVRPMCR